MATIFVIGGILLLVESQKQVEIKTRYDTAGTLTGLSNEERKQKLLQPGGLFILVIDSL